MNPVDAALTKNKEVTLSVDTTECKYCGKLYHTGKKLTEHIRQENPGEQTIYACPYCTQPFNQYSEYLQHLGEHKDRIIRCRICNKEFKTITRLRVHTKTHINQCPFCSENFLNPQVLQDHLKENHGADLGAVERQCSLCKFTCNSISELAEHNQSIHRPYGCNICFLCFSAEYKLEDHRLAEHKISPWVLQWKWMIRATSHQNHQDLQMLESLNRSQPGRSATRTTSCRNRQQH